MEEEVATENDLFCDETLDRKSPDLWPEQVPGVSTFTPKELGLKVKILASAHPGDWQNRGFTKRRLIDVNSDESKSAFEFQRFPASSTFPSKFVTQCVAQLSKEDMKQLNELGHLTADQLMEHIKYLQNSAYRLGIMEARELARGKFLKILELRDSGD